MQLFSIIKYMSNKVVIIRCKHKKEELKGMETVKREEKNRS